jgi:hypothetical protein
MGRARATAVGLRARTLVAQSSPWSQYWFIWDDGNGRVRAGTWERGVRTVGHTTVVPPVVRWAPAHEPPTQTHEREA